MSGEAVHCEGGGGRIIIIMMMMNQVVHSRLVMDCDMSQDARPRYPVRVGFNLLVRYTLREGSPQAFQRLKRISESACGRLKSVMDIGSSQLQVVVVSEIGKPSKVGIKFTHGMNEPLMCRTRG